MSYLPEALTIYPAGTILMAKSNPDERLEIIRYYQRIYYCALVNDPHHKHLAFYDRELTLPIHFLKNQ